MATPSTTTVNAADFKKALTWVIRNIAPNPSVAILGGIKLETTNDGHLAASTFDFETHSSIVIPHDGDPLPEPILVHGRTLTEMAGRLSGVVTLTVNEHGNVGISAGRTRFTVGRMPLGDYPASPPPAPIAGQVDGADLAAIAAAAAACADRSPNPAKLEFGNVLLRTDPGADTVTAWATDRYKATRARLPWDGDPIDVPVPAATLHAATKDLTGPVRLGADTNRLTIVARDRAISIGRAAGELPDLSQLWERQQFHPAAVVDTGTFIDAVQAAKLAGQRVSTGGVFVDLEIGGSTMDVSATDGHTGTASSEVPATTDDTPTYSTVLNSDGLLAILGALGTPLTRLSTVQSKPGQGSQLLEGDGTGLDISCLLNSIRRPQP